MLPHVSLAPPHLSSARHPHTSHTSHRFQPPDAFRAARRLALRAIPFVLCALWVVLLLPAARADDDRWYMLELVGKRSGYLHTVEKTEGKLIRSTSDTLFTIRRGQTALEVSASTEFVETADGHPVSMSSTQKLAGQPVVEKTTFTPDHLDISATQAGHTTKSVRPLPTGDWLTPAAAQRRLIADLAAGKTTITIRSIDPSGGSDPITTTHTVLERATTAEALGKVVPAIKWKIAIDKYPNMDTIEFADLSGNTIRAETDIGGLKVVQIAADKDLALAKADPPELLASTLITPSKPIPNARKSSSAAYVVSVNDGSLPDLPSSAFQKFERLDDRRARLTITAAVADPAAPADEADKDLLAASTMLNHRDPEVARVYAQAVKQAHKAGQPTPPTPEELRAFVYRFVSQRDFSVGFATASEVARTHTGDCTENAVLLAALLRASGVPSRVVSGLIYVEQGAGAKGIFGYHMWTQALVTRDGKPVWINLDATLPGARAFDAAHILLGVSSLADNQTQNFLVSFAPLLNRLRIDVEKVE